MNNKIKYSVIIPTLNEEALIAKSIESTRNIIPDAEIIISDGGSTDNTIEICKLYDVKIINSVKGRGQQLNEGAKAATGEILCFLHADTFLPLNAFELFNKYFENNENKICRFELGFDIENRLLSIYSRFSKYDSVLTRFGDMCITIRKDFFYNIGGYPNWNYFEDVEFLRNAAKQTRISTLPQTVISSPRTFTKYGLINQQIANGYSMLKYLLGFRKFIEENRYYNRKMKTKTASIIIFTRYPIEGKVKTRLASTIGNHYAKEFYKIISEKIINGTKLIRNSYKYVFYSNENEKDLVKKWLGNSFLYSHQEGNNLGEKMTNAFRKVFSHGAKKSIIIGTDIPDLSPQIIKEAIKQLDKTDIVIGPSKDGGYYLLGMKKYYPAIFENIEYSSHTVFSETIAIAEKLNLTYSTLELLQDIDTEDDIIHWIENASGSEIKKEVELIYNLIKGRIWQRCPHCS
ncbi:MAG: TIGR04282 family arsenosugar biosynthesis glycosyltransferase [Ignavibacteria bacterium]|nr:TIGR04282 family arsenosugar biosynthesis glycosyltransferase [Ignavibacteria bacterium]